jgi:uncharacterized protein (DUF488 family)
MHPFYTIGHSTRSILEFVDLLRSVEVTLVVDVRTVPRSRTNPQYNRETLPDTWPQFKVSYEHIASLARRTRRFIQRQRILAEQELSQLRGLRYEPTLSRRSDAPG